MNAQLYALTDLDSGLFWGEATASDPEEAAISVDMQVGGRDPLSFEYIDTGHSIPSSGYAVWRIADDLDTSDWGADTDLSSLLGDPNAYVSVLLLLSSH